MKVAIIGSSGIIGRANAEMFSWSGTIVGYDTDQGRPYPTEQIADCDYAVVCVGTPRAPDGSCDLSYVQKAFSDLPGHVPALLRSTVPPGTTDALAASREGHTAFCPEFLYEREGGAWSKSRQVPYMILGGNERTLDFFHRRVTRVYPNRIHETTAVAAELAKYTVNLYWSVKVTFVNEMAAIAARHGTDWEDVRACWLEDPRVNRDYTSMRGFPPGFGGRCWPKDLAAMLAHCEEIGYNPEFLRSVQEANRTFTGDSDI